VKHVDDLYEKIDVDAFFFAYFVDSQIAESQFYAQPVDHREQRMVPVDYRNKLVIFIE
jgi:hypothetical protein